MQRQYSTSKEGPQEESKNFVEMEVNTYLIVEKGGNLMGKLDKLIAWQEAEQAAPKKRWDSIKDKAIWAVLAAVIAFLLGRIGL